MQQLEVDVAAHWTIVDNGDSKPLGYACMYHYRPIDGVAYFGIVLHESLWHSIASTEAMFLAVDYMFRCWDLRYIYAEMTSANFSSIRSGQGRWFDVVARMSAHQYVDGELCDALVLEISRSRWLKRAGEYRRFFAAPG